MKILYLLLSLCMFALGGCTRPTNSSKVYNPGAEPLTADELAVLLKMYHWKFTQTPGDGQPYWGVRIVAANHGATHQPVSASSPPYQMLATGAILAFDSPVASDGNPEILLGLQIEDEKVTGRLIVTNLSRGTTATPVHFNRRFLPEGGGGVNTYSGTVWENNRVDLADFRDDNRPVAAICLEFLHSAPP